MSPVTPILVCPPAGHQLSDYAQMIIAMTVCGMFVALGALILFGSWLAWWRK